MPSIQIFTYSMPERAMDDDAMRRCLTRTLFATSISIISIILIAVLVLFVTLATATGLAWTITIIDIFLWAIAAIGYISTGVACVNILQYLSNVHTLERHATTIFIMWALRIGIGSLAAAGVLFIVLALTLTIPIAAPISFAILSLHIPEVAYLYSASALMVAMYFILYLLFRGTRLAIYYSFLFRGTLISTMMLLFTHVARQLYAVPVSTIIHHSIIMLDAASVVMLTLGTVILPCVLVIDMHNIISKSPGIPVAT